MNRQAEEANKAMAAKKAPNPSSFAQNENQSPLKQSGNYL